MTLLGEAQAGSPGSDGASPYPSFALPARKVASGQPCPKGVPQSQRGGNALSTNVQTPQAGSLCYISPSPGCLGFVELAAGAFQTSLHTLES